MKKHLRRFFYGFLTAMGISGVLGMIDPNLNFEVMFILIPMAAFYGLGMIYEKSA